MSAKAKKVPAGRRKYVGKARSNWLYTSEEVQSLFCVPARPRGRSRADGLGTGGDLPARCCSIRVVMFGEEVRT